MWLEMRPLCAADLTGAVSVPEPGRVSGGGGQATAAPTETCIAVDIAGRRPSRAGRLADTDERARRSEEPLGPSPLPVTVLALPRFGRPLRFFLSIISCLAFRHYST